MHAHQHTGPENDKRGNRVDRNAAEKTAVFIVFGIVLGGGDDAVDHASDSFGFNEEATQAAANVHESNGAVLEVLVGPDAVSISQVLKEDVC